jgi:hypothetical protein
MTAPWTFEKSMPLALARSWTVLPVSTCYTRAGPGRGDSLGKIRC